MDGSGNVQSRYDYDPYGRVTKLQGSSVLDADFQFANYYQHQNSSLTLTRYRAYDPNTGKWISRDPIAEKGGLNLYCYCGNSPVNTIDSLGLQGDEVDPETSDNQPPLPSASFAKNLNLDMSYSRPATKAAQANELANDDELYFTHYGPGKNIGGWDPWWDIGTNSGLGAFAKLNPNSLSISDDVAARYGLTPGDPVYANGMYLGQYEDRMISEAGTIDIYDHDNALGTDWGGSLDNPYISNEPPEDPSCGGSTPFAVPNDAGIPEGELS